jgi:Uma2 family endonuclease
MYHEAMTTKTRLTADDLERMPDDDSAIVELDEGELVTMPLASEDHGYFEGRIFNRIFSFADQHNLGRVYPGDTGFRLNDQIVRGPDISFVRRERVEALRSQGFAKGVPDLAIEILSPSQTFPQLLRKTKQYLAAGCQVVMIVNREAREIDVFKADGSEYTLQAGDTLEVAELLPGFSVKVGELFQ